ncbi:MAG TPA: iron ABC transporter permease [Arachnia sp.]|nr:iron ABC transporter permease [Arachnia sp.]HMT86445.1 iron ABC transporter permease [Arachnia sp.]
MNKALARGAVWVAVGLIPAAFLAVFFAWPAATLVLRGFHDGDSWTLDGFRQVMGSRRTWRAVGFTLFSATAATLLTLLLGLPGAYLLYRTRFPGQAALRAIVSVPFVLPTVVVGVAFASLFRALDDPLASILLAMAFFNYSVVVRTVGSMWARLDPRLAQAAAALGSSPGRVFATVTLPVLAPAVASAGALVFLFCSASYGLVMVLGRNRYTTVETEIWFHTTQLLDLPGAAALSIVQLVVVTLSLWATTALTRRTALALQEEAVVAFAWRRDWPSALVTGGVIVGLVGAPLAGLVQRSLTVGGPGLHNYAGLGAEGVWRALGTSVTTALAATAIALTLGVLVTLIASRRPARPGGRRALGIVEAAFLLPLGVSAVTVGFGYLITLNRPPLDLRSSILLIPLAQSLVALPLVVRTLLPPLRALDVRQLEAARALGSGSWQVLSRIEFPHLARGLGLAAGFALATSLGEFGATSFLARPDNPTLPVLIFRLTGRPGWDNHGMALAASVVLAVLTASTMAVAERFRPRGASAL